MNNKKELEWRRLFLWTTALGFVGAHRFYVRKFKSAITMVMLFTFTIILDQLESKFFALTSITLGIWLFIDIIMIFYGKFKDSQGQIID